MTDQELQHIRDTHVDWISCARAIEAKVREECAVICEIEADELRDGGWFDYSLVALDKLDLLCSYSFNHLRAF